MIPSLAARSDAPELMDTECVEFEEFRDCLRQLEALNRWSLAYRPTLAWLKRAATATGRGPVSILDVGSGYGDMLRRIRGWARARGVAVELVGIDLNPWSERAAMLATPDGDRAIRYETGDVFALAPDRRFDLVISSHFAHHLDDSGLVRFLRWMEERAERGWFINDLHRHWLPYWFLRGLFAVGRFNRLVVHDGPVSVTRSLTRRDWEDALARAGIDRSAVEIRWCMPFRWGVGRLK